MNIPHVLCIIQARYNSRRLPGKMLLTLGGETLIARAVRLAKLAFTPGHVVVATPESDKDTPLGDELRRLDVTWVTAEGDEADVLGRFYSTAHMFRWHPDSVIVRWTPDDPFKEVAAVRRVMAGERCPVEIGAEAFTLRMLDDAHLTTHTASEREHMTHALFPNSPPPPPPPGVWTIDTKEQYEAACRKLTSEPVSPFDGGPWRPC